LIGEGALLGQQLVKHPQIKAVGFTGSFRGGMALLKAAINEREEPIPVYAEMSSINPVLVLPNKIAQDADASSFATQCFYHAWRRAVLHQSRVVVCFKR
jgi:NADP-dependent aldehyde dehydrogenase